MKVARRAVRRALAPAVEALENRLMFTTAALSGTSGVDNFIVAFNASTLQYTFSGGANTPAAIAASDFNGFTVTDGGGADTLSIQGGSPALLNDAGADGTNLAISISTGAT
jgi:hypothetical protein